MSRGNRSRDDRELVNLTALQDSIKECVRFILCREGSKVPIKRADIGKHLATVCQTATNQIDTVITEADKVLKRVYGYKLIQITTKGGKEYIVILNDSCEMSLLPTLTDNHQRRLLVAALTHIFMSGAPVKEDDMWKFLTDAGLLEDNDPESRKILTNKFKRQMYLQYEKLPAVNGHQQKGEFKWGQRATEELPKLFLLNKVAEAFGKTPDYWTEQFKEATES